MADERAPALFSGPKLEDEGSKSPSMRDKSQFSRGMPSAKYPGISTFLATLNMLVIHMDNSGMKPGYRLNIGPGHHSNYGQCQKNWGWHNRTFCPCQIAGA
jgi:hypothetical protein